MKSIDKFVLVLVASLALLLAGCGGGSSTTPPEDTGPTAGEMAITQAEMALTNAEAGLSGATTDAAMLAAYRAIQTAADNLVTALSTHGGSAADIAAAARKSGNAKAMADDLVDKIANAQMEANTAMAVTAAKLYAGIAAQNGATATVAAGTALSDGERAAAYNDASVPSTVTPAATADTRIMVGIGTDTPVALSEDKDATVAANHGWEGKMYTASPDDDGTYEAVVYSNVGEPTMGKKFGSAATVPGDGTGDYEYQLDAADRDNNANKALTIVAATHAAQIALPSVTRTAGKETFKLPEQNPSGEQFITVHGSLHGVSGVFSCAPTPADGCTAAVAAKGFTLEGGTWLFIPSNPDARVTDVPDANYASYGWWIHKSEDGNTFTASAFVDEKGNVPAAAGLNTLQGTAKYRGGAAGKYALSSSTGGTNDAGHFTARATLEADFSDNSITGTVDNFMGADGMSRDWSVELKEAAIAPTGGITRAGADQTDNDTAWTIGGTAADASGTWSGTLFDNGNDDVPKVGTGTFYTEYSTGGKMVGAFGVNKE